MSLDERQRAEVNELIATEWPKLERFFRTKVPDIHAEDLAQNTIVTYVERRDSVNTNHRGFLWGIARMQVLKHWGSYRNRSNDPFDSSVHSVLEVAPTLSSLVDKRHRILRALQELSADQQMAIELVEGEELTIDEAVIAIGVPKSTLNRYLADARAKLRKALGRESDAVAATYRGV